MTQNEEILSESNHNINTVINSRSTPKWRISYLVEFPMFLVILTASLSGIAISNILLYRTCVHSLNHTESECRVFLSTEKNNETQELEKEVQVYMTVVSTVKSITESVTPAILSLFLGVWSDTHGRKPLIVWPVFGTAMSAILVVVYSMIPSLGPWWYILTMVPYSLTGGFTVMITGAFCYLSDITSIDNRSLRMTILEASLSAGSVIGALASSYVIKAIGNVYLLLISAALNVIAYVFSNVTLRESLSGAIQGGLTSIMDLSLVKEMARECFKQRPNHGRAQILLLTIANSLSIFIMYGLFDLDYMYTREKLHWALKDYSVFSAINTMISFSGSFLGVAVIQKLFGVSDLAFSCIAFVSLGAQYVIRTFAVTTWHMYLSGGISLFRGLSSPLIRSLITKILPVEDIAKFFALMTAIEGLCPLISPLLYNSLYKYTLSVFPGAIYMLSTGITVICIVLIGFVQYYRRNVTSAYQPLES